MVPKLETTNKVIKNEIKLNFELFFKNLVCNGKT